MDPVRMQEIVRILQEMYPDILRDGRRDGIRDPFQILILTILSAQTTDSAVDRVREALFSRYPDPESLAQARTEEVEKIIHSLGFYRAKARYLVETAQLLVERFGGCVPARMEDLLILPGVGRKTANIVLHHAFGRNEGVAVDTHVKRLTGRLGLVHTRNQEGIERMLMHMLPREMWGGITDLLIAHGRRVCTARNPKCPDCPLSHLCEYYLEHGFGGDSEK